MKFLVDECVLGKTRDLIKGLGFSVASVVELGKASACDEEVLDLAKTQEAILLTNDLHFADLLLYPLDSHRGIIVLRLRTSETPEAINQIHEILTRLLKEADPLEIEGGLIIVDRNKYRIHKK